MQIDMKKGEKEVKRKCWKPGDGGVKNKSSVIT